MELCTHSLTASDVYPLHPPRPSYRLLSATHPVHSGYICPPLIDTVPNGAAVKSTPKQKPIQHEIETRVLLVPQRTEKHLKRGEKKGRELYFGWPQRPFLPLPVSGCLRAIDRGVKVSNRPGRNLHLFLFAQVENVVVVSPL